MSATETSAKTFFSREGCLFPEIADDKVIPTAPFLEASNHILPLFDFLGSAFLFVKNDLHSNIKKLEMKHSMNPELYVSINAMLQDEATKQDSDLAQSGALWLKRGIDLLCTFFENMIENRGKEEDSVGPPLTSAYEQVLQPYHGFMVQQIFYVVVKLLPYKSKFIIKLKEDKSVDDNLVYADAEVYLKLLRSNIEVLNDILHECGFDSDQKTE